MKRKLEDRVASAPEQEDAASEQHEVSNPEQHETSPPTGKPPSGNGFRDAPDFESLGLDHRLLQSILHEKFSHPTKVQAQAIPLALEGRDILARAKTGSGKTAAFVLPILESILRSKKNPGFKAVHALILVPTRELADQVSKAVTTFSSHCAREVRVLNLTSKVPENVQRSLLAEAPEVVVGTPAGAALHIRSAALSLNHLSHLVIDEADLVLSYGYADDLRHIAEVMPPGVQSSLMSATLTTELDTLSSLFCKDPVTLALDEVDENNRVSQFVVKCAEDEKFLLAFVIFKLKLVKGKCLIFVADIDRCYRLKLFLEQFGTKSCILNSELPLNSRLHVVEEFNKNVYDIIIASDEAEALGSDSSPKPTPDSTISTGDLTEADHGGAGVEPTNPEEKVKAKRRPRKSTKTSKEYGVSRGIDFKSVACVLNFDLPPSPKSYTHRIGRTARAGKSGLALSFVVPKSLYRKHKPTSISASEHDEEVLAAIIEQQEKKGQQVHDYHFNMAQVEAFRYRMNDALRAVTTVAVREARTRELRMELLNSEKLKRHFEENPDDLQHLRHDGELRAARIQPHLKHVPDYLLPNGGAKTLATEKIGFVPAKKRSEKGGRRAGMFNRMKGRSQNTHRTRDPLQTFKTRNRKASASK